MVMDALGLDERCRRQLEYFCAVTRYSLSTERNDCEKAEDLRVQTVEWTDVADWDVPAEDCPPEE
jgi:hypothetical protein